MKEIAECQAIELCFAPVKGLPCWGVKQGFGSFLELNFGNPTLLLQESHPKARRKRRTAVLRGDWCLLLWCCSWKLAFEDNRVAPVNSESERELILRAASHLNGQKLESVQLAAETGLSLFTFDLGAELQTSSHDPPVDNEGAPRVSWMFFSGTHVLTFLANGKLIFEKATESSFPDTSAGASF